MIRKGAVQEESGAHRSKIIQNHKLAVHFQIIFKAGGGLVSSPPSCLDSLEGVRCHGHLAGDNLTGHEGLESRKDPAKSATWKATTATFSRD